MKTSASQLSRFLVREIRWLLVGLVSVAVVLVTIPTLYLIAWSIYGTEIVGRLRDVGDPTGEWYANVVTSSHWQDAIAASLLLGVLVSIFGTLLNVIYGYSKRFGGRLSRLLTVAGMLFLLLNPLVAFGLSIRNLAVALDLSPWIALTIAHLVIVLPIQFLIFEAAEGAVPNEMIWAARTTGASHWKTIITIFLPNARTAVVGSFILGFFVSFDEIVVALFLLEGKLVTIPLQIWRDISHVVEPQPAVISVIILVASLFAAFTYLRSDRSPEPKLRSLGEKFRGVPKEILAAVGVTTVTGFLLKPGMSGLGATLLLWSISIAVGLTAGAALSLYRARHGVRLLLTRAVPGKSEFREVPLRFVTEGIRKDAGYAERIQSGAKVTMDQDRVERFTSLLFRRFEGSYVGTDRNVPSKYYELYPNYLWEQLGGKRRPPQIRVVLYDAASLSADYRANPEDVRQFVKTHKASGVPLLSVPWEVAEEAARKRRFPSPDVAVFGRSIVAFFDPASSRLDEGSIVVYSQNGKLRASLTAYLEELVEQAMEVGLNAAWVPVLRRLSDEDRRAYRTWMNHSSWKDR